MTFGQGPPRNTGDKPEEEYVTTYYPGAIEQSAGRPVELDAGQELSGIDIRMQKARVYRIRGKVTGSGPQPARNIRLMLVPRERGAMFGFFGGPGTAVKEDGSFEIGYVQPGSYYLTVVPQGPQSTMGKIAVDVTRDNLENVILALGAGATLTGAIKIDGELPAGKAINFASMRVQLSAMEGIALN